MIVNIRRFVEYASCTHERFRIFLHKVQLIDKLQSILEILIHQQLSY